MYKVLIVDDEKLIRIALRNIVDWEDIGCKVIGMAKDGIEALSMVEENHPDIIITDLKMPNLDGIELINRVKEIQDDCNIIVLSNYGEYDKVRMAMKAGAMDYLLKITVEREDIINIINQVNEKNKRFNIEFKGIIEEDFEKVKDRLLSILDGDSVDIYNEQNYYDEIFRELSSSSYRVAFFRIDNITKVYNERIKEHNKLRINLENIIKESMNKQHIYIPIFIKNHCGILLLKDNEKIEIIKGLNIIIKNVNQYLNLNMSMILSKKCNENTNFYTLFENLVDSFEWKFYLGNGQIIDGEKISKFESIDLGNISFHIELINEIQKRNFDNINLYIDRSIQYMIDHKIKPKKVKETFEFILANIEGDEIQKGLKNVKNFEEIKKSIYESEDVITLKEYLQDGFYNIAQCVSDYTNRKYRKEVQQIISYVDKNIENKITLKMISKDINMNESYLSRMFKNETGKNLIFFINEKKMQKAIELLSDNSVMVKEVAQLVGIEDQFYFNKLFKKFYGVSPSKFKQKV